LLKIVLIVVPAVSPQRYFYHVFVDCLNAHWYKFALMGLAPSPGWCGATALLPRSLGWCGAPPCGLSF
jgi:hypothetical protein